MTGIERLRTLAGEWDAYGLGGTLGDVARQIERERACDEDAIENVRLIVGGVIDDMEHHILGHEGMEDSPVARWARDLREALGALHAPGFQKSRKVANSLTSHSDASDVSMSAYDLLPADERAALAWVREHGGRDEVRMELDNLRGAIKETCARLGVEHTGDLTADAQGIWRAIDRLKSLLGDSVPRAAYERRLARRQRQIDESHEALRRRNQRIAVLASEINRAHNENYNELMRCAGNYMDFADEVFKRLAPQLRCVEGCTKDVMDAALEALGRRLMPEGCEWPRYESGELVGFGDEVSRLGEVFSISLYCDGSFSLNFRAYSKGERVRRPAKVLDADGVPTREGDTVWDTDAESDTPLTVVEVSSDLVRCEYTWKDGKTYRPCYLPDQLTHTKPEPPKRFCRDCAHWQKDPTADNMGVCWFLYHEYEGQDCYSARLSDTGACEEFMPSARALAERERGE